MITWIIKKYSGLKPVQLDGALYVIIAMGGSLEAILTSKEVYEYMNPWVVFYTKVIIAVLLAGCTALKMFRSKSYAEHDDEKKSLAAKNLPNGTQTVTEKQITEITNEKTNTPTA